jgi:hypothetical protein
MKSIMKTLAAFGGIFCAATAALAQLTPISNLNQPTGGSYTVVNSGQSIAVSFTTGSEPTTLTGVAIGLAGQTFEFSGDVPGPLNLSLNADASGSPGSLVTVLDGDSSPTNAAVYSYVPDTQTMLAPATTYWIVASSVTSINETGYLWSETASSALDGGSTWSLGHVDYFNGTWNTGSDHVLFSVSAASTNPPPVAISKPIVLTYTNTGVAYALQQNADLSTTNWVTVTNALLSGVLGNQGVFILPPSARQMYFRLSSP